jgi:hypothetical protein
VSIFNPLRRCNSQQAQYYNTPPLSPKFEDEDDDENEDDDEAPGEGGAL